MITIFCIIAVLCIGYRIGKLEHRIYVLEKAAEDKKSMDKTNEAIAADDCVDEVMSEINVKEN